MRGVIAPLIKLLVFLTITTLLTYVLATTISNQSYGSTTTYRANFTDATGLNSGDDVRIAGVRVGTVNSVKIVRVPKPAHGCNYSTKSYAQVSFTVAKNQPLPIDVQAQIRYRNLIGQRYVNVEQGPSRTNAFWNKSKPIPLCQTQPALSLTTLFNGFNPLFQGLDAGQINQLSGEIVQTLQGEGGAIDSLLGNLASLTNSLADKDKVIGEVIDNLNGVLREIGNRDTELTSLIKNLTSFVSGLAADRTTIGNAIVGVNNLADTTSGLLTQIRPGLKQDVQDLTPLLTTLNQNKSSLEYVIQQMPPTMAGLIRTASYGSWFNFYLCSVSGIIKLGGITLTPKVAGPAQARCQ